MPRVLRSTVVRAASVTLVPVPDVATADDIALLSPDERARAARFHVDAPRAAFVTSRAALRRMLGTALRRDPDGLRIAIDANGRPFLEGPGDELPDFNVSHSGALAAIAIAYGGRVGVDVEWAGRLRGLRELVPEVMGVREAARLRTLDGPEFTRAFLECWTRKEALVKGIGIGIAYPLRSIDIPTLGGDRAERVALDHDSVWTVRTISPQMDYTLSVALAGEPDAAGRPDELDATSWWSSGSAAP